MGRIPGDKKEKQKILTKLDCKTLADITGDILYFNYNHNNVKIMDGPGDGKRDIYSEDEYGIPCITQCKYHEDLTKTVSSDETDQLILALEKFKTKKGYFSTTSFISPQAKREYKDNYPGYSLDFFEGSNIVDEVYSSPILKKIWVDDIHFTKLDFSLNIAFVIIDLNNSKIINDIFVEDESIKFNFIKQAYFNSIVFDKKFDNILSNEFIHCYVSTINNCNIHDTDSLINKILRDIISTKHNNNAFSVVFSSPYITNHDNENKYFLLEDIKPIIFNIDAKTNIIDHFDFIVPKSTIDWAFPENLSVAQAPWACWYNENIDSMMQLFIEKELPLHYLSYETPFFDSLKLYLNKSLFVSGSIRNMKRFIKKMKINNPDWECNYGYKSKLYAWMHPMIEILQNRKYSMQQNKSNLEWNIIPNEKVDLNKYKEFKENVESFLYKYHLEQIDLEKANFISKAEKKDLIIDKIIYQFGSAELFHDFNKLPLPLDQGTRFTNIIKMWKVEGDIKKIRKRLETINFSDDTLHDLLVEVKYGPSTMKLFIKVTLTFEIKNYQSFTVFLENNSSKINTILKNIDHDIKSKFSEASEGTKEFLVDELDFKFDNNKFQGRPWIATVPNST